MAEEKIVKAYILGNGKIRVFDPHDITLLQEKGGYGTLMEDKSLELFPEETLYLVEKNRLKVLDEKGSELSYSDLLKCFSSNDDKFWLKYILYYDLRKRGFIVKEGFKEENIEYRVKKVTENIKLTKYMVIGVQEGVRIAFMELEDIVKRALRAKKVPIIAVIDKEGNVSYYSISPLD
ncbi:MAG: hypothetical protein J7K82_06170 [Thermoproteales archaeon]|nr:hypothetical protein [Thermoproteales archaeon]